MTRGRFSRPAALAMLALAAALALALGACGRGSPGGSTAASAASAVASPSAAQPALAPAASGSPDAPATSASPAAFRRLFAYDAAEPLGFTVVHRVDWGGVTVRRVGYVSAGSRVTGYLSLPPGRGPFPAVLYAPGVSCRASMFAADAAALQRAGVAVLAVDPPDGRPPYAEPVSLDPATVAAAHVRYVTDLRRGLDLLASLSRVDAQRVGYVGYSWGGYAGGLLAGLRAPVKAYVLTYAGADWVAADPAATKGFLDPAAAVAGSRGAAFLFQDGVADALFSRASVTRYYAAAAGPKTLRWYPGGHGDLWQEPGGAAVRLHRRWLERVL